MYFKDIIGQEEAKQRLLQEVAEGRVAHARLLCGPEGSGKLPLAVAYARYLCCTNRQGTDACGTCPSCVKFNKLVHPDVHFVFPVNKGPKTSDDKPVSESYVKYWRELALSNPYFMEADLQRAIGIEGKSGLIAVQEARSIISKLSLTAVADGYKAVIFYLPEKMNQETANRLLKMVEEPPVKTIFLFITHAPEKVLQTIFSRCQSLRVLPMSKEDIQEVLVERMGISPSEAQAKAAVAGGSVVAALGMIGDKEEYDRFMGLFSGLMNALTARDLSSALECGEQIAALESREKQKGFCTFAGECIRKIFMLQQNLPQIAVIPQEEEAFYSGMAQKCGRKFCSKTIANIEKVSYMIDRNVNSKILFCDLVNRMYFSI